MSATNRLGNRSSNTTRLDLSIVDMRLDELIDQADLIAVVNVQERIAVELGDFVEALGLAIPYSRFSLALTQIVATGDEIDTGIVAEEQAEVWTLGGDLDDNSVFVDPEASLTEGEDAILFLSKDTGGFFDLAPRAFTILGFSQGHYQITDNGVLQEGSDFDRPQPYADFIEEIEYLSTRGDH